MCNCLGTTYVGIAKEQAVILGSVSNTLKFTVKEIDPQTGEPEPSGFEDEYQVNTSLVI